MKILIILMFLIILLVTVFLCEYDIDMVHKSIDSARVEIGDHVDDSHLVIFRLKKIHEKDLFNESRFLRELGNYIFSSGEKVEQYTRAEIQTSKEHELLFGLDVTRNIIDLFLGNKHNHHFDYRMIHLITEHKRVLYNKWSICRRNESFVLLCCRYNCSHYTW